MEAAVLGGVGGRAARARLAKQLRGATGSAEQLQACMGAHLGLHDAAVVDVAALLQETMA